MEFFNLQEGEKIAWEAKPLPGLKWMFFLESFFIFFILIMFTSIVLLTKNIGDVLFLFLVNALLLIIIYVAAVMRYDKEHYWITNDRVIHKTGFIGYSIYSIPLERVSDVIISHSLLENILGIASVHVQSLAGQVTYRGGKWGAEGALRAVKDPEGLQKMIFELVKKNRAAKKIAI